ncbi:unnamed protein product [Bursaphelenchus xylophilus]|uniref:(pine wood nematode) hypothetical protein n=1 Tax=Bursaphelenchus xylophilus TaxID=6326 RepID=A0A7I8XPU9_BURXY|nr:unnamed protein product [Bursaphelenchus xylophilus]CAG9087438.1 unnamed protein product [Bursaphelenchus xylophilus]
MVNFVDLGLKYESPQSRRTAGKEEHPRPLSELGGPLELKGCSVLVLNELNCAWINPRALRTEMENYAKMVSILACSTLMSPRAGNETLALT